MAKKLVRTIEEIKDLIKWTESTIEYHSKEMIRLANKVGKNAEAGNLKNIESQAKSIVSEGKEVTKAKRELRELKAELKEAELQAVEETKGDAIDTFLQGWRKQAREYYINLKNESRAEQSKEYEITKENLESVLIAYSNRRKYSDEKIESVINELPSMTEHKAERIKREISYSLYTQWRDKHFKQELAIIDGMYDESDLDKILDKEVNRKKVQLIKKVEAKAGKIIDAKGLHIGVDGNLNGQVIGENGTVTVNTIYAGGHNVQCLHYRVLVK